MRRECSRALCTSNLERAELVAALDLVDEPLACATDTVTESSIADVVSRAADARHGAKELGRNPVVIGELAS